MRTGRTPGGRQVRLAAALALAAAAALGPAGPGAYGATSAPAGQPGAKPAAAGRPRQAPAPAPARRPDPADLALYERLSAQVNSLWDEGRGGYVRKDGTPSEAAVELALARGADGDTLAMGRALRTLRWMHGLLDTVGGGYLEGARDMDHTTTSFEKRTDFNLRRLGLLARVAARKDETFARDARRVLDHSERLLTDPAGGFYTAQFGSRDLEPESNGEALRGWWRWCVFSSDVRRRDFAFRTQDRLWKDCRESDLGMVRRDTWGKVREPALLADQTETGLAFLHGWQAAGRDSDLARARALANHVRANFEDRERGGYRTEFAAERFGHTKRFSRPYEDNAVAARFLAEMGAATGDTACTNSARRAWTAFGKAFEKPRLEAAEWALAVRATWAGPALARGNWSVAPAKKAVPAKKPAAKKRRR